MSDLAVDGNQGALSVLPWLPVKKRGRPVKDILNHLANGEWSFGLNFITFFYYILVNRLWLSFVAMSKLFDNALTI